MNRRTFITWLGGGVLFASPTVGAQQPQPIYRIGWLDSTGTGKLSEPYQIAFVERLRELGFEEGRNLVIEFRTTKGRDAKLPELAAELARQNCDLLLAPGTEAGLVAIEQSTRDTPIVVVANDYDPVAKPPSPIPFASMQTDCLCSRRATLSLPAAKSRSWP